MEAGQRAASIKTSRGVSKVAQGTTLSRRPDFQDYSSDASLPHMAHVEHPGGSALALTPMQQLAHAKEPDDDWTGLKDRAERKKRQTRLNVRAHRT